jgi:hypothetical protein
MNNKATNQSDQYSQIGSAGNNLPKIGFFQDLLPYLMLIGYDFRDKFFNFFLNTFGDRLVQFFTVCQHFANFGPDGRPVEKKDASGVSGVPTPPAIGELQPPSLAEDAVPPQEKPSMPLIAQAFRIGYMILLAARYGVGKTFLAIYAVLRAFQENYIASAAIFSLEDRDGKQKPRFEEMLKGYDFTLISPQEFTKHKTEDEQNRRWAAGLEADFLFRNPAFLKFMRIYKETLKEKGASLKEKKPINLMAFLSIADDLMEKGIRFFVLDSLTKIFGDTSHISTDLLDSFLEVFKENGATLIVIHHLNREDKFYGSSLLLNSFDEAYIMQDAGLKDKPYDLLKIKVEKKRYQGVSDFWIKRTRVSEHVAQHEVLSDLPTDILDQVSQQTDTVKDRIKQTLMLFDSDVVNREDLLQQLGTGINSRTVTNNLIELEKEGIVKKADPHSWGKIKILK